MEIPITVTPDLNMMILMDTGIIIIETMLHRAMTRIQTHTGNKTGEDIIIMPEIRDTIKMI